ncbi:MAG TPA: hypothetical protein VGA56_03010 [Opitutaceae bacterium]
MAPSRPRISRPHLHLRLRLLVPALAFIAFTDTTACGVLGDLSDRVTIQHL